MAAPDGQETRTTPHFISSRQAPPSCKGPRRPARRRAGREPTRRRELRTGRAVRAPLGLRMAECGPCSLQRPLPSASTTRRSAPHRCHRLSLRLPGPGTAAGAPGAHGTGRPWAAVDYGVADLRGSHPYCSKGRRPRSRTNVCQRPSPNRSTRCRHTTWLQTHLRSLRRQLQSCRDPLATSMREPAPQAHTEHVPIRKAEPLGTPARWDRRTADPRMRECWGHHRSRR